MEQMDAVTLTNLFPTPTSVNLRGGSTNWATGMTGQIQSLFVYNGGATQKMYAVDGTARSIYDVTTAGAVGAAKVTGLTNALWEYTNVATSGGNYMYCVNGFDKPLLFDGTTWTPIDGASTPAITGVTTTGLNDVLLFKNRVWFTEKNTLKLWYLPTLSIGGAAQYIDLRSVARKGGYVVAIDVWTTDAGFGLDDMLVIITNNGEVIIYRGTDPASAATWALVGVWQFGAPVTNRCTLKWGGDLLVNTLDGLLPLSAALQSDRLDPRVALSDKIQNAISLASSTYGTNTGWQIFSYPADNMLILNVPISVGSQQQYVMNTITKSWCNFTGMPANCWDLFGDLPYYGGNGVVVRALDTTYADNNTNINTIGQQAFNYFGQRGIVKYFTRLRPAVLSSGFPTVSVGINVDFNTIFTGTPLSFTPTSSLKWGIGLWGISTWGHGLMPNNNWQGCTGIGYCGSIQFASASSGIEIQWASTDVVYQAGWAGI